MPLPEDIITYVQTHVAPAEQAEVLALLQGAKTHEGEDGTPRLLRCALVASKGNVEALRYQVKQLTIDYRDVIVAGEYTRQGNDLIQVRNLSIAFT